MTERAGEGGRLYAAGRAGGDGDLRWSMQDWDAVWSPWLPQD
ncbi:hypothetical protein ACFWUZ_22235 [Streptomyces sp. NPDC058646]